MRCSVSFSLMFGMESYPTLDHDRMPTRPCKQKPHGLGVMTEFHCVLGTCVKSGMVSEYAHTEGACQAKYRRKYLDFTAHKECAWRMHVNHVWGACMHCVCATCACTSGLVAQASFCLFMPDCILPVSHHCALTPLDALPCCSSSGSLCVSRCCWYCCRGSRHQCCRPRHSSSKDSRISFSSSPLSIRSSRTTASAKTGTYVFWSCSEEHRCNA